MPVELATNLPGHSIGADPDEPPGKTASPCHASILSTISAEAGNPGQFTWLIASGPAPRQRPQPRRVSRRGTCVILSRAGPRAAEQRKPRQIDTRAGK